MTRVQHEAERVYIIHVRLGTTSGEGLRIGFVCFGVPPYAVPSKTYEPLGVSKDPKRRLSDRRLH